MSENTNYSEQPEMVDIKTYKMATKRAHFKKHIAIYILVMIVIWVLYAFIFRNEAPADAAEATQDAGMGLYLKCALFVSILWTVIIFFQYLFVYKLNNTLVDKEIKKLQKELEEKKKQLDELKQENENQNA